MENVQTLASLLEGVDFMVILSEIKSVIPVILGPTLALIGFRKAWHFAKGQIVSA